MKRILTIMLFAGTLSSTTAQTRINACGNEWLIQESRRLHADKEFPGVLNILSRIERSELSLQQLQEVDYALATATFEINPLEGRAMMLQYLSDYPESSKREILAATGCCVFVCDVAPVKNNLPRCNGKNRIASNCLDQCRFARTVVPGQ